MSKLDQTINSLYGNQDFQRVLLRSDDRDAIIAWLCWNDPNGCYTDEDSEAEGLPRLTLNSAKRTMARQIEE